MPTISQFYGIAIAMYFDDHARPHFHAKYAEFEAEIEIETLRIRKGRLPPRVYGLVAEWGMLRRDDLRRAWAQASRPAPIDPIDPLP